MSIQTITRQALLKKVTEVVNQLPDERLQQVWKQFDAWATIAVQREEEAIVEFAVAPRQEMGKPLLRLPIRSTSMPSKAHMEVAEPAKDDSLFMQRLQANIEWWNQHFAQIRNNTALHDRYIAISDGEVFTGTSYEEAYSKARAAYPNGVPYLFFLKAPDGSTNYAH